MKDAEARVVRRKVSAGLKSNTSPSCFLVCVSDVAVPVSVAASYSRDDDVHESLREMSSRGWYSPLISILLPYDGEDERYLGQGMR